MAYKAIPNLAAACLIVPSSLLSSPPPPTPLLTALLSLHTCLWLLSLLFPYHTASPHIFTGLALISFLFIHLNGSLDHTL